MKIAIHGGMAVGKTTLIKQIEQAYPNLNCSYEDISPVTKKIHLLALNKNEYCDYLINQDFFIKHEIKRYKHLENETVLMDYSAEEVAFQTLTFPKVFHSNWQMHHINRLAGQLLPYYVNHILYLDASPSILKIRKQNDCSRPRKSFDDYLHGIHVLKREWFRTLNHVTFLDTSNMNQADVFSFTISWLKELGVIHV